MISGAGGLSAILGNPGEGYKIVSAPLQNNGAGSNFFQPIIDASHDPINVDSVSTSAGTGAAPGQITVNYANINAKKVCDWQIVPDETLVCAGYNAGASVGLASANINLAQAAGCSDLISSNGTTFSASRGAASPFTINSFTSGVLSLSHPSVGGAFGVSLDARSLDGTTRPYTPIVAQSGGVGAIATNIEFWNEATGAKVTVQDTNMRVFVTRPGFCQADPRPVDTVAFPNSNLWFLALFQV